MTDKLFYTDPLAATYMAREFGVKYVALDNDGDEFLLRASTFANKDGLEQYSYDFSFFEPPVILHSLTDLSVLFEVFNVHPYSYHILDNLSGEKKDALKVLGLWPKEGEMTDKLEKVYKDLQKAQWYIKREIERLSDDR